MRAPGNARALFFLAAVLWTVGVVFLELNSWTAATDLRLSDRLLEERPASEDILIVAIDDKSIQAYGVWPWPRSLHAQMIDRLREGGAEWVGYDVTFSEASTDTEDSELVRALWESTKDSEFGGVIIATEPNQPCCDLNRFQLVAHSWGDTTLVPSEDGVVRHAPVDGFAHVIADRLVTTDHVQFPNAHASPSPLMRIPFVGPRESFQTVSFVDVMNDPAMPLPRVVLVGSTAADLHDEYVTPMNQNGATPGIEILANVIQNLVENRNLRELSTTEYLALVCVIALLLFAFAWLQLRYFVFAALGLLVSYLLFALALASQDIIVPLVSPILLIIGLSAIDLALRYAHEKQRRGWVQKAFGHYLAPQVIEKLLKGETKLELGGVKNELTILFSDIRGFTSLSEQLTPEQLVSLLNEYLTAMTDLILESEGVVDKYIGDAIMAFWGAPLPQSDHAMRAARTAVAMKRRLAELQTKWKQEGRPSISIGVGLNTGSVIVGNMGSKQRFDYTVMGDDVNLASRLEGLTKQYGVTILVSEATVRHLDRTILRRPIDRVAVKGRKEAVKVFELDPRPELVEPFTNAFDLYQARRWMEASTLFKELAAMFDDAASKTYLARCEELLAHDPGSDWDGVWHAKEK